MKLEVCVTSNSMSPCSISVMGVSQYTYNKTKYMYICNQKKTNAISLESVDDMSHSLPLVDGCLCQCLAIPNTLLYVCHTVCPYNSVEFLIFTLLHFVNGRGGGEGKCVHALLRYSQRCFDGILHIWYNCQNLIEFTNNQITAGLSWYGMLIYIRT